MSRASLGRHERRRQQARRVGAAGFLLAAALPVVLFHRAISDIAAAFQFDFGYFTGWTPWLLILAGLAFFVPVAWSAGRDPESRWYPRARNAYAGWGITLYLLGFGLATQVVQIHDHVAP
jgi:hypothetical protein